MVAAALLVLLCALMLIPASAGAGTDGSSATTPRSARSSSVPTGVLFRVVDADGRTGYSDRPPPLGTQARRLTYGPSPPRRPTPPAAPLVAPIVPNAPTTLAQPALPEALGRSQQQVVTEVLARQVEALQSARNALKEGEAVRNGDERNYQRYLDRIQGLRDAVTRQEGVVDTLQGQLRLLGGGLVE
jgi:hypothetical protein